MTGPLEMAGADDALVCEDGVCEIPATEVDGGLPAAGPDREQRAPTSG